MESEELGKECADGETEADKETFPSFQVSAGQLEDDVHREGLGAEQPRVVDWLVGELSEAEKGGLHLESREDFPPGEKEPRHGEEGQDRLNPDAAAGQENADPGEHDNCSVQEDCCIVHGPHPTKLEIVAQGGVGGAGVPEGKELKADHRGQDQAEDPLCPAWPRVRALGSLASILNIFNASQRTAPWAWGRVGPALFRGRRGYPHRKRCGPRA